MMRGISRQAVAQNTPIKGTTARAADIADKTSNLFLESRYVWRGYEQAGRAGLLRFDL